MRSIFKIAYKMKYQRFLFLFAVIFGFSYIINSLDFSTPFSSALLSATYSYVDTSSVIAIIRILAPSLICIIITAGFFTDDFDIIVLYVFYRTSALKKWFLLKVFSLLLHIIEFYFIVFFTYGTLFCIIGKRLYIQEIFSIASLVVFLFSVLFTFAGVLAVNVFSFIFTSKWSSLLYCLFIGINAALVKTVEKSVYLYILNPIYNFFIQWHTQLNSVPTFYERIVGDDGIFTIGFSIKYFLLMSLLFFFCGICLINRKDLCLRKRG